MLRYEIDELLHFVIVRGNEAEVSCVRDDGESDEMFGNGFSAATALTFEFDAMQTRPVLGDNSEGLGDGCADLMGIRISFDVRPCGVMRDAQSSPGSCTKSP